MKRQLGIAYFTFGGGRRGRERGRRAGESGGERVPVSRPRAPRWAPGSPEVPAAPGSHPHAGRTRRGALGNRGRVGSAGRAIN